MARIMRGRLPGKVHEVIALTGFVLFYAFCFVRSTMMCVWLNPGLNRTVTYLSYFLAIGAIITMDRYSWKELLIIAAVGVIAAMATGVSDSNVYLMYLLYLIPLSDVRKDRIARAALFTGVTMTILTIVLSKTGVIEDLVYQQQVGLELRQRESMGFIYPTDFAAHIFFLLLIVFYLTRGRLNLVTGGLYLFFAWFVKTKCDARLSAVMLVIVFIASLVLTVWKRFRIRGLIRWGMILAAPIGTLITFGMDFLYARGNRIAIKLDSLLSDRLSIGARLLDQYGIRLLGQNIEQHGNGGTLDSVVQFYGEYSFIDMSFQRIPQMYGLLAFGALLVFVVWATKKQIDKGAVVLPVVLTIVAINSIVDQHYLDFAYNIFLFMLLDKPGRHFLTVRDLKQWLRAKKRRLRPSSLLSPSPAALITPNTQLPTPNSRLHTPNSTLQPEKSPSIRKNFILNVLLKLSTIIFPLITFPYVSRVLHPAGTGKVQFATSIISYFTMVAQLGISGYGIRACAKVRDNREKLTRTAHELLMINLIMSVVAYVALFVALRTIPRLREERTLYLILSLNIILTSIGMEWLYQGLELYGYITARSVLFKFLALIAMFLLIHQEEDYLIYGGITIFAASASNILNLINAHRYIDFRPVGDYHLMRHLKPVLVFFAMVCATTIYTNLDNVMLGFMTTDVDVGYYGAAVKIKTVLVSVVTSLGTVLLPRLSYYVEHGALEEFRKITRKAFHIMALSAAPLSLFFILFAREGVLLLSGAEYEGAILPMQVIMPTVLLIGLSNITGVQILVPTGREKTVLYSEIVGAVVDVVLNALLIPRFHATGAAIGTLVAEAVVLLVQYLALKGEIGEAIRGIPFVNLATALGIGVAACFWVRYLSLGYFLTLAVAGILFFGAYGGFLYLRKEEFVRELAGQVMGKLRGMKR